MKERIFKVLMSVGVVGMLGFTDLVYSKSIADSTPVVQAESAESWLARMQDAAKTTNYQGTFVFSRGDVPSTVRISHRYKNGVEQERLTQLDGAMGEIIRNGTDVMCVLPDQVLITEKADFTNGLVESFSDFDPGNGMYDLGLVGTSRLIDREAVKVSIKAKDKDRYSYELWLDKETGLLLKSSLRNHKGDELERFQFSQIDYPESIADEVFEVSAEANVESHTLIPAVAKDFSWPGSLNWSVKWMPEGFEPLNSAGVTGQNVLVYSDGLASFSVFVEQVQSNSMPEGASLAGGTTAYFHKVVTGKHHYGVTVLGEIPPMTAMMVAESVKPLMADSESK